MKVVYWSVLPSVVLAGALHAGSNPEETARAKTSHWLWTQMHSVDKAASSSKLEALVYLKDQADLTPSRSLTTREEKGRFVHAELLKTAQKSQASLRNWLTEHEIAFTAHWVANMIVVKNASADALEEIARREDVLRVVGNPQFKHAIPKTAKMVAGPEPKGTGQNLSRIQADKVWSQLGVKGQGIVIAGQDTGVQWDHPALKPHYRGWNGSAASHDFNWHDAISEEIEGGSKCGYNLNAPCDDNDHGTHTVGTVVGDDNSGNQIGVAPGASWIACRNMDNGVGRPSTYVDCFEFFLAPWKNGGDRFRDSDPAKAPHVINNSWGCPPSEGCEGAEFEPVLRSLEAAGIFVVVSAGNSGSSCGTIQDGPAYNTTDVLSVGAMSSTSNKIASFSSRGPSTFDNEIGPHVTAPGVNIRSCVPGNSYAQFGWSGTSMAGPHVVGVVALMWSAQPSLIGNIDKTREILKQTAEATTEPSQTCGGVSGTKVPNNTWGYGTVDALKAVKAAQALGHVH